MSDTAARLARYIEAEARILKAQSLRMGDREAQQAELAEVRKAISDLEGKLAAEQSAAQGGSTLSYARGNLTGFGLRARCGGNRDDW